MINGIQSHNNSQSFQATHYNSKEIRRAFINGQHIVDRIKQEKGALDEMSQGIDLYFMPGHTPEAKAAGKDFNILRVRAEDRTKRPSASMDFCYAYLIGDNTISRTAKSAIEKLNAAQAV